MNDSLFSLLCEDHAAWSQATFGNDKERGPTGPLKHLQLEVEEVLAAPTDVEEYADCLLLILDASRRAGFSSTQLVEAAHKKLLKNKARVWPKAQDMNSPVFKTKEAP